MEWESISSSKWETNEWQWLNCGLYYTKLTIKNYIFFPKRFKREQVSLLCCKNDIQSIFHTFLLKENIKGLWKKWTGIWQNLASDKLAAVTALLKQIHECWLLLPWGNASKSTHSGISLSRYTNLTFLGPADLCQNSNIIK